MMEPFTLRWAAEKLEAPLSSGADGMVTNVCIDTRRITPGALFFALQGEQSDGHRYVAQALANGAVGAVVSQEIAGVDGPLLLVPDTLQALGDLAMHYRRQFDIPIVGITGSVGKTSTKEMAATALRARYNTLANEKNYNNEIGVPLTLFQLNKTHEVAVIEMGMRGLGQIDRLAEIAEPTIGVITNIGYAHIELLDSQQNIAQAKSELLARLPTNGVAILPTHPSSGMDRTALPSDLMQAAVVTAELKQSDLFAYLYGRVTQGCRIVTVGDACATTADIALHTRYELQDGGFSGEMLIETRKHSFTLHVPGAHNIINAQTALAVAYVLGVPASDALQALSAWQGAEGRMALRRTDDNLTILDDCYNAGPDSMTAALETLSHFNVDGGGRRIAVLGDMKELGEVTQIAHRVVGIKAALSGLDLLVTVGPLATTITDSLKEMIANSAGNLKSPQLYHYKDTEAAAVGITQVVKPGDTVLVKGSRAMEMEKIVAALVGESETGTHG